MNNIKKTANSMTEEEIRRIKELDWASYHKTYSARDSGQIMTCPKCKVMIFPQPGETEFICKRCGEMINL
jgi:hypothetical protein